MIVPGVTKFKGAGGGTRLSASFFSFSGSRILRSNPEPTVLSFTSFSDEDAIASKSTNTQIALFNCS